MNFIKLSMSHDYLYSPKSWLHYQKNRSKIITIVGYLALLPAIPLQYILLLFFALLIVCGSINIPRELRKYFYAHFAICSFFLLISVQKDYVSKVHKLDGRKMLYFYRLRSFYKTNTFDSKKPNTSCFCLPLSAIRLTSLHFTYIIAIRLLLITTSYVTIINTTMVNCKHLHRYFGVKFVFATIVSSHLLKILFNEIKSVQISYILRSANLNYVSNPKTILLVLLPFLQEFLTKTSVRIYSISSALYSRSIQCANLDMRKPYTD